MRMRFIVLSMAVIAAWTLHAQPKMEIAGGNKFDFGSIHRGKTVDHKVIVKNVGTEMLELGKVDASCGCTGTVITNGTIPPGKAGEVLITFNSTNFTGKVHKTVTINSNATNNREVFEFEANVIQELFVNPQQFWFKEAEVGRSSSARVSLTNNSSEPVTLTSYQNSTPGFSLALPKEPVKPGASVDIVATFKPQGITQVLNENVSIKTSSKTEPEVSVRIFGSVKEFKFQ